MNVELSCIVIQERRKQKPGQPFIKFIRPAHKNHTTLVLVSRLSSFLPKPKATTMAPKNQQAMPQKRGKCLRMVMICSCVVMTSSTGSSVSVTQIVSRHLKLRLCCLSLIYISSSYHLRQQVYCRWCYWQEEVLSNRQESQDKSKQQGTGEWRWQRGRGSYEFASSGCRSFA